MNQPFSQSAQQKIARNLRAVLTLPRASKHVADFLFSSLLDSDFHPAHALPPTALSVSLPAAFIRTIDLEGGPFDPPFPDDANVPPHALAMQGADSQRQVREEKHALLVPVAAHPPYSLGYIIVHNPSEHTPWPAIDVFPQTFIGRFAFDTTTHNMVCLTHASAAACLGFRAVNLTPHGARETIMLSVPALDYTSDALPTDALWSANNVEYPGVSLTPSTPGQCFEISAQNTSISIHPDSNPLSVVTALQTLPLEQAPSTSLPPTVHAAALTALAHAHFGVYFSPSLRIDFALGPASVTSCTRSEHVPLPRPAAEKLRIRMADMYYAAVLSVSADAPLQRPSPPPTQSSAPLLLQYTSDVTCVGSTPSPSPSGDTIACVASTATSSSASNRSDQSADSSSGNSSNNRKTEQARQAPSARRIQPRPPGMAIPLPRPPPPPARAVSRSRVKTPQELAEREQRRLARRDRNRLSAARSNERRRLMLESLKTDIASQQKRASELIERLRIVTAENIKLREQLVGTAEVSR